MKVRRYAIAFLLFAQLVPACGGDSHEDLTAAIGSSSTTCTSSKECGGATPVCDELARTCVQCLFPSDCDGEATCEDKKCVDIQSCSTSLDCVDYEGRTICDPLTSSCVQCVEVPDCAGSADCIGNKCVPYTSCESSLDCSQGQVCAAALGRCAECESRRDCDAGDECIGYECKTITPCVSDNQCVSTGQLCDKALGYCVDCLDDEQCPEAYHCSAGACALDTCQADSSKCEVNSILVCSANGDGWGTPQPCASQTSCRLSGSTASCEPWICVPGQTYCDDSVLTTCADDGLSVTSTVDCASSGKHCFNGTCSEQVCSPNLTYCEGKELRNCDAMGSVYTVLDTCDSAEYCDAPSASCKPQLCSPGSPVCDGNVATTCNGTGSCFSTGGVDCETLGQVCAAGGCVDVCADVTLDVTGVPLDLFFMLDTSGSMSDEKIEGLRTGLGAFFNDPQSTSIGASGQKFPLPKDSSIFHETCDGSAYAQPAVPWEALPNPALGSWVSSLETDGYAPSVPALTGAVEACRTRMSVVPTHKCAVVFTTDGEPNGNCPPTSTASQAPLGEVAAAAMADGIPVFAIGLPGSDPVGIAILNTIAQQGGTGAPIMIQSGNVGSELTTALNSIRGDALGCEFQMPTSTGTVDPDLVALRYTPGGGSEHETERVVDAAQCSGQGWYYDNNNDPTKLIVCPDTCAEMQEDQDGEVRIVLGCSQ